MRLRHLALPSVAGLALLAIPFSAPAVAAEAACDPAASSCAALFDFTGGTQTFTVPANVTNLIVALVGAGGGNGLDEGDNSPVGGSGAFAEAIVPVTPGETLTLVVGGKGGDAVAVPIDPTDPVVPPVAPGGYGGGGAGTAAIDGPVGGGGGGSFLFGSDGLLIAVGGGGGAGFTGEETDVADGGAGGSTDATVGGGGAFGGGGATATGPGAAGAGDSGAAGSGPATGPDAFGAGGAAAGTCSAGGGGGGYFGGGSGACDLVQDLPPANSAPANSAPAKNKATAAEAAAADVAITPIYGSGGGGGGAGFVGTGVSTIPLPDGLGSDGNGAIALGYTTAATTTALTTTATTLAPGEEATLDATVSGPALTIGSASDENSPAGRTARAAFGTAASKALTTAAVPTQPAADGTTVTPGTACGTTPCTVTFLVNGVALGDPISVDPATGVASVVFTAGSDMGVRSIVARYDGNLYYLQSASAPVSIDVVGLADTGTDITPMLLAATGLLVAGGGLLAYGRRRPTLGAHRAA